MGLHESDVRARLARFLDRKQMPRRLEGKPTATDDEIAALLGALGRNAPRNAEQLAAWWPIFEARLGEICGAMWPTEKEVRDAAKHASQDAPRQTATVDGPDMRPVAVVARRMAAGQPVGDDWLWGRNAVELAVSGLVGASTVEDYRRAAFWARVGRNHPTEDAKQAALAAARKWEDEAKARHESAKQVWRTRDEQPAPRDTTPPQKSARADLDRAA